MTLSVTDTNLSSLKNFQCYIGYWLSVVFRHICLFISSSCVRFFCFTTFPVPFPRHLVSPFSFSSVDHFNIRLVFFSREHIYVFYRITGRLRQLRTRSWTTLRYHTSQKIVGLGKNQNVSYNITCPCRNLNPAPHYEES